MKITFGNIFISVFFLTLLGCKIEVQTKGSNKKITSNTISGFVFPLMGLISEYNSYEKFFHYVLNEAQAVDPCVGTYYAKLFQLGSDGSINENSPIGEIALKSDSTYQFELPKSNQNNSYVNYIVRVEGCNGSVFKRPVTAFNNKQNLNSSTTIISEIINSNSSKKMNEVLKSDVSDLIAKLETTSSTFLESLDKIQNDTSISSKFIQVFNSNPNIILDARPEVTLNIPTIVLNEESIYTYSVNTFHVAPSYSFAYVWKIDGVVASQSISLNYIPSKNSSGDHQIEVYVGKNNGSNAIDTNKPYFYKAFRVSVNNNILPTLPAWQLSNTITSPTNNRNVIIDITTGVSFNQCDSFSHFAITDTNTTPGIMQFNRSCLVEGTQVESIMTSTTEGVKSIYLWAIDNEGFITGPSILQFTLDTTPPVLSLTNLPSKIKGGSTVPLNFLALDSGLLNLLSLSFSFNGGISYGTSTQLLTNSINYNWIANLTTTLNARLKLTATDTSGNSQSIESNVFEIDSTAPNFPNLTLVNSNPTTSNNLSFTAANCTDTTQIYISESLTPPVLNQSGVQTCSTSPGGIVFSMGNTDGHHNIYAWAIDETGNVSSMNSMSIALDTTAPIISSGPNLALTNTNSGAIQSISWSASDIHSFTTNLDFFDGTNWNSIAANLSGISNYSWTVPSNVNSAHAKFKITTVDSLGNSSSAESSEFIIDNDPPNISNIIINDNAYYAINPLVYVKINLSDTLNFNNIKIRLSEANESTSDCQSEYADNNWQNWTSSSQVFSFSISNVNGIKKICVWAKDPLGNTTVQTPSQGINGVTYSSIIYQTGHQPLIDSLNVTNNSTGTLIYNNGDIVKINWTISDIEGLSDNPISFSYTTDGSTWRDVVTNLDISNSANVTWMGGIANNATSLSGTYTGFSAPSNSFFMIKAIAKDNTGSTSIAAMSQSQNTSNWSVFAGSIDRGDGGTGASAALYSSAGAVSQHVGINPLTNDVYAFDEGVGIRKLDAKTGKVSTFLVYGATNLPASGTLSSSSRANFGSETKLYIDSLGVMYLNLKVIVSGKTVYSIYKINLATNEVSFYFGGGLDNTTNATASNAFIWGGTFDFDQNHTLYYLTDCDMAVLNQNSAKKILTITQNSDGTPGSISHFAGNCSLGSAISGQPATTQPLTSGSSYGSLMSIAVVNPNLIYFASYGSTNKPIKFINGLVYTTNFSLNSRAGSLSYNSVNNKIYHPMFGGKIEYATPVSAGDGGEVTSIYAESSGTGDCTSDGILATNSCINVDGGLAFDISGIAYFVDGVVSNASNGYRVRYVDIEGKVRTIFGSLPFFGDGMKKNLIRGSIAGIYYKKSTEPNQASFPAGLYLVSPSMVFGRINESDGVYHTLLGNQQGNNYSAPDGTIANSTVSMGIPYAAGNGKALTFDADGLPWIRSNYVTITINSSNQIINLQSGSTEWNKQADNANPINSKAYVFGGYQNFTLKNKGLFFIGGYAALPSNDPTPQIRYLDFLNNINTIIMGGNTALYSQSNVMSPDISTIGGVKNSLLDYRCSNGNLCMVQYEPISDRLYFKTGHDSIIRYITTPDDPTQSTLGHLTTNFFTSGANVRNFIFTETADQIFYITSNGLYCLDISSGKTWCNNSTNLYPYSATLGGFGIGPNQMTWKNSTTLLISTYTGKVLQYNFPP